MGKVVVIEHLSLDGVVQGPAHADEDRRDGFTRGGWAAERGGDPTLLRVMGEHMGDGWALLVGRRTFEDLAGHWPQQPSNPFTDALNAAHKYVVSTTLDDPLEWRPSTVLKDPGAVAEVRERESGNLVVFGSGELVSALLRLGLVDELVLQVHPVVLGAG
ncbi:dihydrofolate reductase family protein, partial [Actinomadura kijaniata]|uniref:dihydrofolate reductase family protein n=1 Tax=Actinomadura kijaniata TaxID=46161 RepID=UPI003F1A7DAC